MSHLVNLPGTMWNIILGIVFVIGGLSGKLALIGTNSGAALAAVGVGMIIWGGFQIAKTRRGG
ncbi:MAG: hypothetical protein KDM63_03040 [Verrucomicrobiae bacterium]|nr:hypothetical protein [Verrucomicrobiae bacterium]MCB1085994.1 hypothetical protein [Verrucomicrobiae bacterium]MCB1093384.1 hypothetical protein [Verrucomicrobiae bacterium]